ncbi:hypothetical protein B0T22DRAFT_457237 [Podospora appendiculata]|uniref:Uncharacterized protein n=1 Tax=Podospora appendiculata TaxID=314037 RepID=A0AAE1CBH6_9PEZI|nr:hypothetical protein B0T22DRAFT_457237 [Podospora appendiculata]
MLYIHPRCIPVFVTRDQLPSRYLPNDSANQHPKPQRRAHRQIQSVRPSNQTRRRGSSGILGARARRPDIPSRHSRGASGRALGDRAVNRRSRIRRGRGSRGGRHARARGRARVHGEEVGLVAVLRVAARHLREGAAHARRLRRPRCVDALTHGRWEDFGCADRVGAVIKRITHSVDVLGVVVMKNSRAGAPTVGGVIGLGDTTGKSQESQADEREGRHFEDGCRNQLSYRRNKEG